MFEIEKFISNPPFNLTSLEKEKKFLKIFRDIINFHYKNCKNYKKILDEIYSDFRKSDSLIDLPFLPTSIFKNHNMLSVKKDKIIKTISSSGTSGKTVSKIFLDKKNSINQTKVLNKIVSHYIGKKRLPMLVFDKQNILKDRNLFSARGAAILGFSVFANDITFALNENDQLNKQNIRNFLNKHKDQNYLIFGFTSIIWEKFYKELKNDKNNFSFENGILIHGGGWKKLESKKVTNKIFRQKIKKKLKVNRIHNYYGMVEQTGSIFFECDKCGFFNTHNFSEIIIRDSNFNSVEDGKVGIVQLFSVLPSSYPGHILLTEDIGYISNKNDCSCSYLGKRFKILGRVKNAELRGCSDV